MALCPKSFFFFKLYYLRERERARACAFMHAHELGRKGRGKGSLEQNVELDARFDLTTLRSQPELKPRVDT